MAWSDHERIKNEVISPAMATLWDLTGRHYVSSGDRLASGDTSISSDFYILEDTIYRRLHSGRGEVYALWSGDEMAFGENGETIVRVCNPLAETVLTEKGRYTGFLVPDIPPGVTLEDLGYDAEFYYTGGPRMLIERVYDDSEWELHQETEREKIKRAIEKGTSRV